MADPRVLMVDDDEQFLSGTVARLKTHSINAAGATSGEEALALARQRCYDVILLDLSISDRDAVEVFEEFKELQPFVEEFKELQPFVEVIVLADHDSVEVAMDLGRMDAFQLLEKHCDDAALASVIRDAHRKKRENQIAAYREELARFDSRAAGTLEIMEETRRLREKYEL